MNFDVFILSFLMTAALISVYLLIRNSRVFKFRTKLLKRVSDLAKADIEAGREWKWRYERLDSVSYQKMLFSVLFLKEKMYFDDTLFLEDTNDTQHDDR